MQKTTTRRRWRRAASVGMVVMLAGCAPAAGGCSPVDDASPTTSEVPGSSTTTPGSSTTIDGSTTTVVGVTTSTVDPGSTTTTIDGTTTTVPPVSGTGVEDLRVEDCVSTSSDDLYVDTVTLIDCDEPHEMEVFARFELDGEDVPGGEDGGYPGGSEITWFAQDECQSRFESYTGEEYLESRFDFTTLTPSFSTWDAGDRLVTCLIIGEGGSLLDTSAKGARR